MFATRYQTAHSPVHRAVWDREFPSDLFSPEPSPTHARPASATMDGLDRIGEASCCRPGRCSTSGGKISDEVFHELGEVGYWGLLVDPEYGGGGAPFSAFAPFLTRMATVDPTVAGLASVHGCIGAVDPRPVVRHARAETSVPAPAWPAANASPALPSPSPAPART